MLILLWKFEANCNSMLSRWRQDLKIDHQTNALHLPISATSRFLQRDASALANRKLRLALAHPQRFSFGVGSPI